LVWIVLCRARVQLSALIYSVMKVRATYKAVNFLIIWRKRPYISRNLLLLFRIVNVQNNIQTEPLKSALNKNELCVCVCVDLTVIYIILFVVYLSILSVTQTIRQQIIGDNE
jgi:hypothetical protein